MNKLISIVSIFLIWGCTPGDQPLTPPNIILIMADDLGYGDLSSYGSERINTPNIDFLAENGLRFTDYHANAPVCTPTRAALLTGRYQQRAGLEGVIHVRGETRRTGMDTSEVTLAEVLKEAGYVTGMFGKWHLAMNHSIILFTRDLMSFMDMLAAMWIFIRITTMPEYMTGGIRRILSMKKDM